MESKKWAIGDSVVVKLGVIDPDLGGDLSGWQGRITAIYEDQDPVTVGIEWDSLTLKSIPEEHIAKSEEEGLSWSEMNLYPSEVAPAVARDTEDDVAATIKELEPLYNWRHLGGEQGKRVQEIVNSAQDRKELTVLRTWHAYLKEHLKVPFRAVVEEYDEPGPIREGDRVTVMRIMRLDNSYGTIVAVKHKSGSHQFPLCDLKAPDADTQTEQLVDDYAVWFANR